MAKDPSPVLTEDPRPANPLSAVLVTARRWSTDARESAGDSGALARVGAKYGSVFELTAADLYAAAAKAGPHVFEEVSTDCHLLGEALRNLVRFGGMGAIDLGRHARHTGEGNPYSACIAAIDDLCVRLERFAPILAPPPPPSRPMLTAVEQLIWDALAGKAMTEPKLEEALDHRHGQRYLSRVIGKMRRKGYPIKHVRARGYLRPDAPPPSS